MQIYKILYYVRILYKKNNIFTFFFSPKYFEMINFANTYTFLIH